MLLLAMLAAFAVAGSAPGGADRAGRVPAPWDGGYPVVGALEARATAIARELSGRRAMAHCNSPAQWESLAQEFGLEPDSAYAFVPPSAGGGPAEYMHISPLACRYDDAFLRRSERLGQKRCVTAWRNKVARGLRLRLPVLGECARYQHLLETVEALGHEAMHVAGIRSEAVAECLGFQVLTIVARRLGATASFAYEMGRDYTAAYEGRREVLPEYWSAACVDGGVLDLWPDRMGWPTPAGVLAAGRPGDRPLVDPARFPSSG